MTMTRNDNENDSGRDYGDFTEFGGGPGRNDRTPDGMPRRLYVSEEAQEVRTAGIRNEPGPMRRP